MKEIVIKNGNKTTYRIVPDDWVEQPKETPQRDLTTTQACLIALDMTKEDYDRIFHKENSSI